MAGVDWFLNGTAYPTVNELNKSIGDGAENAWKAWFYYDEKEAQAAAVELAQPKLDRPAYRLASR